jgi:hypothetical protein
VSKRPRESTLSSAETLRDLEERLKKNSPMKERVVEEKLTILHDSEVRARHDFDMN